MAFSDAETQFELGVDEWLRVTESESSKTALNADLIPKAFLWSSRRRQVGSPKPGRHFKEWNLSWKRGVGRIGVVLMCPALPVHRSVELKFL